MKFNESNATIQANPDAVWAILIDGHPVDGRCLRVRTDHQAGEPCYTWTVIHSP
ncbi:MAG: hypothetical protein ACHQ7M_03700 [Chloroflexota bacterium]